MIRSGFLVVLAALSLAACAGPPPPAPEPPLAALARAVLRDGVDGVTPEPICRDLGVHECTAPTVKSKFVIVGNQAKFAQVYLKSPQDISLGIRTDDDASVFLTTASGELVRGLYLSLKTSGHAMSAAEAAPLFDREKQFWLQWTAEHAATPAR